jgi:hypothetical protein
VPIYIGSAYGRLRERVGNHLQSITAAKGIEPEELRFRYMQLTPDRHRGIENLLIEWFRPVWNKSGFGNKVTGVYRLEQKISLWDIWHPGRLGRGGRARDEAAARAELARRVERSRAAMRQALGDDWSPN